MGADRRLTTVFVLLISKERSAVVTLPPLI